MKHFTWICLLLHQQHIISSRRPMDAGDTSCWATSLHADLVRLIGWRVLAGDLLDYVRFRAVCPLWRSSTARPRGRGLVDARFRPRQWMVMAEKCGLHPGHPELLGYVRFFNLCTGYFVRSRIPLFENHKVLDSADGLILLLREQDHTVRLLHPFTGDIAVLPPLTTLLRDFGDGLNFSSRDLSALGDLSATSVSVSLDGVITVLIIFSWLSRVAFASSGIDHQWRVSTWSLTSPLWWSVSFKGRLYVLCYKYYGDDPQFFQIDPPQHKDMGLSDRPKLIATCRGKIQPPFHLVACDSDIFIIGLSNIPNSVHMLVYRLADLIVNKVVPVTSIGGNILFANYVSSLSVSARALPTIMGDGIVTTAPGDIYFGKNNDLGIYHLKDCTWLPAVDADEYHDKWLSKPSSPRNLVHRIFWRRFNLEKFGYYFSWNKTRPSLVKTNWRDEV
ncbi:uncharacterized protein LOC100835394 isoform X3 [Brachypodium distachyon]|uniref:uncharacterized protein LOC100835394 isoform X3 n=1 Tax=Brachypodium distachyon TaxID=15368 RepID=UPI00052FE11C|nr:uncharacterized protein LOC100835394 isoform X3 [Brachypodium distachyon]|eukprot:XP_024314023.1 uncharacterized protein LOC100835394 isoform X3 [Brachypodium distachyon]